MNMHKPLTILLAACLFLLPLHCKNIPAPAPQEDASDDLLDVQDAARWPQRRAMILDLFQGEMYGRMPAPSPIFFELVDQGRTSIPEQSGAPAREAVLEQYRMWFKADRTGPSVVWLLVKPADATAPLPVILLQNFHGNDAFLTDTRILGPDCCDGVPLGRGAEMNPAKRYYTPLSYLLSRGYAFLTAYYEDFAPDPDTDPNAMALAFKRVFDLWAPRDPARTDNPTTLTAWAWGYLRGMDLVEQLPALDASRVLLTGCSRLGKAALIAAACDERFAIVAPVQTGGGGAPLTKHPLEGKETIASETSTYPNWFLPQYALWAGREQEMPFDQHMLLACIAPRPLLVLGYNNKWFDPEGEYLSVKAAAPIWSLLGVDPSPFPAVERPEANASTAIGAHLGYVWRTKDAGHGILFKDWKWMLDFADPLFKK